MHVYHYLAEDRQTLRVEPSHIWVTHRSIRLAHWGILFTIQPFCKFCLITWNSGHRTRNKLTGKCILLVFWKGRSRTRWPKLNAPTTVIKDINVRFHGFELHARSPLCRQSEHSPLGYHESVADTNHPHPHKTQRL